MESIVRCSWCAGSRLYEDYHDNEWGRPVYDEQRMHECLLLETFQAGLSWITVLKKRENFRTVFHQFDVHKVAKMTEQDIQLALNNPGIIRHEGKIRAAVSNAQCILQMKADGLALVDFFWNYTNGAPIVNRRQTLKEVPSYTPLAEKISKDLKKRGFKFVGATTIYSFLQATGIVNDHLATCQVYLEQLK